MNEIRLKLQPASIQFRCSRETIKKGLQVIEAKPDSGGAYTIYDIHRAIAGDRNLEIIKGHRLDNELKEVEIAEKRQQMMSTADAMAVFNAWGLPIRQKLCALDSEMKHRCNPIDPDLAGKALGEWKTQAMRLVQAEIRRISEEVNATPLPPEDATEAPS